MFSLSGEVNKVLGGFISISVSNWLNMSSSDCLPLGQGSGKSVIKDWYCFISPNWSDAVNSKGNMAPDYT